MEPEVKAPQDTTVLVTGIGGFLARHVAQQLLQKGYVVRGTLRSLARGAEVEQSLRAAGADTGALHLLEADLLRDEGWAAAAAGCDAVIHTASPFPSALPKSEEELIRPAKEGTLRVLRAAYAAGVRRVVLTSSIAATNYGPGKAPFTEEDWTDVEGECATPYYKSKTLAERAAWDFARETGLELAVINPGMILGPLLGGAPGTSVDVVRKLFDGEFAALPRFGIALVDVRDVADAHLRAMTSPAAAGQRFIAGGRFLWLKEVAEILRERFPERAARIPKRVAPDWLVRILARFDPTVRLITGELSRDRSVSADKAKRVLGWTPRPAEETLAATVTSLIAHGRL